MRFFFGVNKSHEETKQSNTTYLFDLKGVTFRMQKYFKIDKNYTPQNIYHHK